MIFYLLLVLLFFGGTLVYYSISPNFSALGLVIVSIFSCIVCGLLGYSFFALVLILIYMGGMLVVFVYSSALSVERFPKVGSLSEMLLLLFLFLFWIVLVYDMFLNSGAISWNFYSLMDLLGGSNLFDLNWFYLLVGGYILLLVLVIVLVLNYGIEFSILKAL
uniref:NADH dehydrogenase subunit 6 n=1 Tax=Asthenactis papyraceus TaxID=2939277 RepID=UPI002028C1E7|nr:NADH dehydrogenase subunit 6 [Asthenactis papyraceus]UPP55888.1 NADH dehydrogenase subunit 6 [Asthenactis papyraceus]